LIFLIARRVSIVFEIEAGEVQDMVFAVVKKFLEFTLSAGDAILAEECVINCLSTPNEVLDIQPRGAVRRVCGLVFRNAKRLLTE